MLSSYKLTYKKFGDQALLIEWPQKIENEILNDVLNFKKIIEKKIDNANVIVTNAYNSLLINDLFCQLNLSVIKNKLPEWYILKEEHRRVKHYIWKIPVCYDSTFGIDLEEISKAKNLSIKKIIENHSNKSYTVYFIGFLPGFLYLGGLESILHIPRKSSPRLKISNGAVAIGGEQTGIYPMESPGGWNIIGNSPVNFFDIRKDKPCFAKSGDAIQFYPVTLEKYKDIKILVDAGVYELENELIND